jgi:hypothetical protein
VNEELKAALLSKTDLFADKLPCQYDGAFLGWSVYQPHHHLPSPVYDVDKMFELDRAGCADKSAFVKHVYATYVANTGKKTFAPVFVSETALTKEQVL